MDVKLTHKKDYIEIVHNGEKIRVQRIQDQSHMLTGDFSKTSRKCPPFCLQPMEIAPGVKTVGEIEIFNFMEKQMREGTGLLIDARLSSWHKKETIPGSINIPFSVLSKSKDSIDLISAMQYLNVKRRNTPLKESFLDDLSGFFSDEQKLNPDWDYIKIGRAHV